MHFLRQHPIAINPVIPVFSGIPGGTLSMTVISIRHELIDWYKRRGYQPTGEMLPFHPGEKFGTARRHLELAVLEKSI